MNFSTVTFKTFEKLGELWRLRFDIALFEWHPEYLTFTAVSQ